MAKDHLAKDATLTTREDLITVHKESLKLLNNLSDQLSKEEYQHGKQTTNRRRIPTPILFIKDHKKQESNRDYSTRLYIPAGNVTSPYPHLG